MIARRFQRGFELLRGAHHRQMLQYLLDGLDVLTGHEKAVVELEPPSKSVQTDISLGQELLPATNLYSAFWPTATLRDTNTRDSWLGVAEASFGAALEPVQREQDVFAPVTPSVECPVAELLTGSHAPVLLNHVPEQTLDGDSSTIRQCSPPLQLKNQICATLAPGFLAQNASINETVPTICEAFLPHDNPGQRTMGFTEENTFDSVEPGRDFTGSEYSSEPLGHLPLVRNVWMRRRPQVEERCQRAIKSVDEETFGSVEPVSYFGASEVSSEPQGLATAKPQVGENRRSRLEEVSFQSFDAEAQAEQAVKMKQ